MDDGHPTANVGDRLRECRQRKIEHRKAIQKMRRNQISQLNDRKRKRTTANSYQTAGTTNAPARNYPTPVLYDPHTSSSDPDEGTSWVDEEQSPSSQIVLRATTNSYATQPITYLNQKNLAISSYDSRLLNRSSSQPNISISLTLPYLSFLLSHLLRLTTSLTHIPFHFNSWTTPNGGPKGCICTHSME